MSNQIASDLLTTIGSDVPHYFSPEWRTAVRRPAADFMSKDGCPNCCAGAQDERTSILTPFRKRRFTCILSNSAYLTFPSPA
jgi:hypothetical protein